MAWPLATYRMTAGSIVQPFFPGQPAYLSRDAELAYLGDVQYGRPLNVQAGALVRIRFDLTSYLPVPQQRITSVGAVLDEDSGADTAPGSRLYGAPVIESSGKMVHQDLLALATSGLYILTFTVILGTALQKRFKVPFYTTADAMPVNEIDTTLPVTGGPITSIGTIGLQTPLAINFGGTGAITAPSALASLGGAPLASPSFTGVPTAPTPATGDNSPAIATTAFVKAQGYLTGNQTITLSGDVTGSGTSAISTTLAASGVTAGTYNNVTVNAKGLATGGSNVAYLTGNQTITLSGDISGSGATAITTTLPTVNSNVGTFQGITVNGKGLVTAAVNQNYAPLASPALTGSPTAPTPATADNSTAVATTAFVKAQAYAPLASPALTGTPTAPTASIGTATTQVATTAFVANGFLALSGGTLTGGLSGTTFSASGNITSSSGYLQTQGSTAGVYIYDRSISASWLLASSSGTFQIVENTPSFATMVNVTISSGFGQLQPTGGYRTQPGNGASPTAHVHNIDYTTTPQLWIDGTNIGTFAFTSDERLKSDIQPTKFDGLAAVLATDLFQFRWRDHTDVGRPVDDPEAPLEPIGFVAQRLPEQLARAMRGTPDAHDDGTLRTIASLDPNMLIATCFDAIKQLTARVGELAARIEALEARA